MIQNPRNAREIDAVSLYPLRESEEVRIANCVMLAHDPRPSKHSALDHGVRVGNRFGYLPLHRKVLGHSLIAFVKVRLKATHYLAPPLANSASSLPFI